MRSVYLYLRSATRPEVERWLSETYRFQAGPAWIVDVDGDACLFIEHGEHQLWEWQEAVQSLGWKPTWSITADVSGRHPGDEQVRAFVLSALCRFEGAAMDDYTQHGWKRTEVESNSLVQGHRFFDYLGWFEESRSGS